VACQRLIGIGIASTAASFAAATHFVLLARVVRPLLLLLHGDVAMRVQGVAAARRMQVACDDRTALQRLLQTQTKRNEQLIKSKQIYRFMPGYWRLWHAITSECHFIDQMLYVVDGDT
jgi:hypothetical protein